MSTNVAGMQQQQQHSRGESVECWDDDPDFADIDDIPTTHYSPNSAAATATASVMGSPTFSRTSDFHNRRESLCSSRMSMASAFDLDGLEVGEHELPLDESPAAAIASAIRAGIPIPENVPSSALVGGTIKRLGNNKKSRKIAAHDDWSEDLELPTVVNNLNVRRMEFPDALDEIMDGRRNGRISPFKMNLLPTASSQLNKFRDSPDDDDFMKDFDDLPPLQISSSRLAPRPLLPSPPSSEAPRDLRSLDDDFDADFEFPADAPLRLNIKTVDGSRGFSGNDGGLLNWDDLDSGIGGSYCGGSRRGDSTNGDRMNAGGLLSPTMTAMTMESEDEMPLDGLILPEGGLPDLNTVLEKRKRAMTSPTREHPPFHVQRDSDEQEDDGFFDGIEIGDGELFDARKLTLNRNVKQKQEPRKKSPTRRTAMSLTFTTNTAQLNTPKASASRNRLSQGPGLMPSSLEPVAERENPPSTVKRIPATRKRWSTGNPDGTDDLTNIPPPPPIPTSRFERERSLSKKASTRGLAKNENTAPTTTSAQLLRAKRSMPSIPKVGGSTAQKATRQQTQPHPVPTRTSGRPSSRTSNGRPPSSSANSSGRPTSSGSRPPSSGAGARPGSRSSLGRPPSRTEAQSSVRPKTPHGNSNINFRRPTPFLPAGSSVRTSHHITTKPSRQTLDRSDDRAVADKRPTSRLQQRSNMAPRHSPSSSGASTATTRKAGSVTTPLVAPDHLRREAASTMTQPTRKRNFGDGTELEAFDDLPTSVKQENRFTVAPVAKGAPRAVRPKSMSVLREEQPKKKVDRFGRNHQSQSEIPSYLRDTAASRNAREITQQRLGMTTVAPGPPSPTTDRWRTQIAQRSSVTPRASRRKSQAKPHLIKPMGSINTLPKESAVTGMTYNPRTMRWDGNEKDLQAFETTENRTENRTPPRAPALITKVNASNATPVVQVVGGMVFDPSRMCWLKVDEDPDDEDDPFEGVEDIPADDLMSTDNQSVAGLPGGNNSIIMGGTSNFGGLAGGPPRLSGGFGEFVVGEEFDVGPMFVGRQKEEEERWRKRTDGWILPEGTADSETGMPPADARYLLRELLADPGFLQLAQQRR